MSSKTTVLQRDGPIGFETIQGFLEGLDQLGLRKPTNAEELKAVKSLFSSKSFQIRLYTMLQASLDQRHYARARRVGVKLPRPKGGSFVHADADLKTILMKGLTLLFSDFLKCQGLLFEGGVSEALLLKKLEKKFNSALRLRAEKQPLLQSVDDIENQKSSQTRSFEAFQLQNNREENKDAISFEHIGALDWELGLDALDLYLGLHSKAHQDTLREILRGKSGNHSKPAARRYQDVDSLKKYVQRNKDRIIQFILKGGQS